MGSKKKNSPKGSDKTKGHQNGHQKPTNGPKVDKKGSSAKPQDKSDQVGKRETTQAPPKGSSSKLWLTILLISAATAGVAILAMNESAQATVGDVYKKHLHTHVLQAAELLSIDVSSFRMWWDEADSNSKQDAPPAEHRQQQEVSQPPPSQSDKRSGDKAKESKMQNDQGEDSTPQKSTAQRAADSEQEREVAEGDKVSEKPVQKDQGEKSQPQKSTAQTAAEDSKQKQDTDEGDKAPEKPVVQDIRVKSTHKTEKDSTQERAGQEAKVGEEQTPDKPSPEPPSPPAPAESSGEKEDVGGDTKDIKPPKSGRESYAKSAITNDDDYKVRKKLDEADDLLELGQLDEALQKFDSIIRKHPTSPRAHAGKADVLDKLAEKKRSNQLLEESIKVYGQLLTFPDVPAELMKKSAHRLADRQQFRGWGRQSVKTMQFLVDRFPDDVQLQRELGVSHLMVGQDKEAKQVFEKILKIHPDDGFAMVHLGFVYQTSDSNPQKAIPLLLVGINSNDPGTQDGRFYFQLGSALQREGRTEEAEAVYQRGANKGLFLSAHQRSLYNVDSLTGRPWWTKEQTGYQKYLKLLEDNWKVIRDEGLSQLNSETGDFMPEDEDLREKGDWKQLTMYAQGRKKSKVCAKVPKTCALIDQIEPAKGCRRGQVKFSVMQPGVHVWPHCGPTNCRIRAHLGLVVPEGPMIRVVNETRTWKEGKFIIFDDSFEHEVWHDGKSFRLVLIVDFWHPELSESLRRSLSPI